MMPSWLLSLYRFCISIKTAVVVILLMASALAVGTVLESLYDTRTAGFWVYRALWFRLLLAFFGMNIFLVAMSRWPWKRRHVPFLLAHLGILLLLAGSWMTQLFGVDANMALSEGQTTAVVEGDDSILYIRDSKNGTFRYPVRWIPPHIDWSPTKIGDSGLRIENFITHAEQIVGFEAIPNASEGFPAVKIRLKAQRVGLNQANWLWGGGNEWSEYRLGPAVVKFVPEKTIGGNYEGLTLLEFRFSNDRLSYTAYSSKGTTRKGTVDLDQVLAGNPQSLDLGWGQAMGGIEATVEEWIPFAKNVSRYARARHQYGSAAPGPALEVVSESGDRIWLGKNERGKISVNGIEKEVIHVGHRQILPFALLLNRFEIQYQEGTANPASYSSQVMVMAKNAPEDPILISMNEPLDFGKYTFYQSSYIPAEPRPTVSILTVNYDPGRWWKYLGSLLIVIGSVMLFWRKYKENA